jgi:hypothetical protein
MPLTFSNVEQQSLGSLRGVTGVITFDASYVTGGEPFTPSDIGLGEILSIGFNQAEDGFILHWDKAANTILAYYADYDAVADGALIEVANAVDLSGVVVEFIASGR